jgi:hypothetical protein
MTPEYYIKTYKKGRKTYELQPNDIINFFNMRHYSANAFEYVWRAGLKTKDPSQDLSKAMDNLRFAIEVNEPTPFSRGYVEKFTCFIANDETFMEGNRFTICKAILIGDYNLALNLLEQGLPIYESQFVAI